MKFNTLIFLFLIITFCEKSFGQLRNLLNTSEHQCISCICHSITACYDLKNCARASIDFNYWLDAGGVRLDNDQSDTNRTAYQNCIINDNCILNTIYQYVYENNPGGQRCRYPAEDCRDFLIFHYNKRACRGLPRRQITRYDNCATKMSLPSLERDTVSGS